MRRPAELLRVVHPAAGLLSDPRPGKTDLAVSEDGRYVAAAHYGQGAVSIIDVATLTVASEVDGIAEPYAVAAAGRACAFGVDLRGLRCRGRSRDRIGTGRAEIGTGGRPGVSRSGELLYVARSAGAGAGIAVIDIERPVSGIVVSKDSEATVDAVRRPGRQPALRRAEHRRRGPIGGRHPHGPRARHHFRRCLDRRHRRSSRRPAGFRHRLGRRTSTG